VPRELDDLVVALLAKDPADRPTAAQFVARLGGSSAEAVAPTVALGAAMPGTTQLLTPDVAPASGGSRQVWAPQALAPARNRTPLIVTGAFLVLALLAVVLVLANSGSDTTGTAHAGGSSSPSTRPSSRAVATRVATSSRPAPAPTSVAAALAALRTAVTRAGSTGALSASDARDLLSRIDAMSATASGSGSGATDGKPGKGHGGGKGKGHHGLVQDVQVGADLTGRLDDFLHHLDDLHKGGKVTDAAYSSIRSAAEAVRPFAGG
jgi:serine/threonine-protein kinase